MCLLFYRNPSGGNTDDLADLKKDSLIGVKNASDEVAKTMRWSRREITYRMKKGGYDLFSSEYDDPE